MQQPGFSLYLYSEDQPSYGGEKRTRCFFKEENISAFGETADDAKLVALKAKLSERNPECRYEIEPIDYFTAKIVKATKSTDVIIGSHDEGEVTVAMDRHFQTLKILKANGLLKGVICVRFYKNNSEEHYKQWGSI